MEDQFIKLRGKRCFWNIDAKTAFFQVPLAKESQEL